jgi:hypothetical protein
MRRASGLSTRLRLDVLSTPLRPTRLARFPTSPSRLPSQSPLVRP